MDVPHVLVAGLDGPPLPFGLTKVPDHLGASGQRVG